MSHAGAVYYEPTNTFYIVGGSSGQSSGELKTMQAFKPPCPEGKTGKDCSECLPGYGVMPPHTHSHTALAHNATVD